MVRKKGQILGSYMWLMRRWIWWCKHDACMGYGYHVLLQLNICDAPFGLSYTRWCINRLHNSNRLSQDAGGDATQALSSAFAEVDEELHALWQPGDSGHGWHSSPDVNTNGGKTRSGGSDLSAPISSRGMESPPFQRMPEDRQTYRPVKASGPYS